VLLDDGGGGMVPWMPVNIGTPRGVSEVARCRGCGREPWCLGSGTRDRERSGCRPASGCFFHEVRGNRAVKARSIARKLVLC